MDIIIKADKYLNGNHHLLNIIFSYLGESPSAKVMKELTNDEDIYDEGYTNYIFREFRLPFPRAYFKIRDVWVSRGWRFCKKYTPLHIPRFKVDCLQIEDDVDCERCAKLLTYQEREHYEGYCEYCYGKVYKMGGCESDEEPEPDTDDSDEWGSETDED